jgi:hypothetical protein
MISRSVANGSVLSPLRLTLPAGMWDPWAAVDEDGVVVGFANLRIKGAYVPAIDVIVLRHDLGHIEERCTLAEELGHRTLGHKPHPSRAEVDRMEQRAARWAAVRLVTIGDLMEALRSSDDIFEIAELLGVDPELLEVRIRWLSDDEKEELGVVGE